MSRLDRGGNVWEVEAGSGGNKHKEHVNICVYGGTVSL